jgi:hypothetical protein
MAIGPNSPYTNLDQNQILQRSFEEGEDRLRVSAEVTATIGTVECIIDAASGDNISITNADGTNPLAVNANGSINVNVVSNPSEEILFQYDEVSSVVNGVTTTVISYTPSTQIKIVGISVSGTNVATYEVLKASSTVSKMYTSFTGLNAEFNLSGMLVNAGQNIRVDVVHYRPDNGDFTTSIKYIEV